MIQYFFESGFYLTLRSVANLVTIISVSAFAAFYYKKFQINKLQAFAAFFALEIVIGLIVQPILPWIESGFTVWGNKNYARVVVYVALIEFLVAKMFKADWRKLWEFVAPCVAFNQGLGHLSCIFTGCCHGYPSEFGIYNPILETKVFPTQPIEGAVALSIGVVTVLYTKKNGYRTNGKALPLVMILFGYTRFLLEFLRDNNKLFWGISNLALHALFCGIVGTVLFVILSKKEKRASTADNA